MLAWTKYNVEGNADSLKNGHKVMQQANIRDTDSKKSKDFLLNPFLYLQCVC